MICCSLERRSPSSLFDAIRELMAPPVKPKRRIGFRAGEAS